MGSDICIKSQKAVFLDRDGVVIKNIYENNLIKSPKKISEIYINKQIQDLTTYLYLNNIHSIIVTNQPDISRKKISLREVEVIHRYLIDKLKLSAVLFCPHDDIDNCQCRKPKSEMLEKAKQFFELDYGKCMLIGDRTTDVICAKTVNVASVHIANVDECNCDANWHSDIDSSKINQLITSFFSRF